MLLIQTLSKHYQISQVQQTHCQRTNSVSVTRISTKVLLFLILISCQLSLTCAVELWRSASARIVNPFHWVSTFPRRLAMHSKQHRLPSSSVIMSSSARSIPKYIHQSNDHECNDEADNVRSLVLSSNDEKSFFRRTDHALLEQQQQRVDYKRNIVECSSVRSLSAMPISPHSRPLVFWENMICGAISRSIAQTVMHPANTMKTILQSERTPPSIVSLLKPSNFRRLSQGAGANFLLSVPHGAVNFAVLEFVRARMNAVIQGLGVDTNRIGPGLDFCSSAISTICCSIVSTPQMMM
jgi:Mitochondrial carrier protein